MMASKELICPSSEFYALGKKLTDSGICVRLGVRGQSMYPSIRDGDVIEIVPIPLEQVQVGDIVFFRSGARLFAHRVIQYDRGELNGLLVTRGDNCLFSDHPLQASSDFVGRVESVYRDQRVIGLECGWIGHLGRLAARHRLVHYALLGVSRFWRLLADLIHNYIGDGMSNVMQGWSIKL